jgi:hypothetical protein
LLCVVAFASEPENPPPVTGTSASTSPRQEDVTAATAESEFPPRIIRPEAIWELVKGSNIVCQVGGMGVHNGKGVGIIGNTYEVELPGFEGIQRVEVDYIQREGTIISFKGPGFLYRAEDNKLVRKKLVRLSSDDKNILEDGIRQAIKSSRSRNDHRRILVLVKEDASFPPSKDFLCRLSDVDVTLTRYQDWDPRKSDFPGEAIAEIVRLAPDRVEFRWKHINVDQEVERDWACEFRFHNGEWVRHSPQQE